MSKDYLKVEYTGREPHTIDPKTGETWVCGLRWSNKRIAIPSARTRVETTYGTARVISHVAVGAARDPAGLDRFAFLGLWAIIETPSLGNERLAGVRLCILPNEVRSFALAEMA